MSGAESGAYQGAGHRAEVTRCGECGGRLVEHRCEDCGTRHDAGDGVETWFNLTPGYREAILREHGLAPPWERPSRFREAVSRLLWRLHLYGLSGWWDAGTDIRRMRRGR